MRRRGHMHGVRRRGLILSRAGAGLGGRMQCVCARPGFLRGWLTHAPLNEVISCRLTYARKQLTIKKR